MITVIVPVYKVELYLDRCVESIIGQTYSNIEIILVDDGSPDNCPVMCEKWKDKDTRIRVIHKKNGGLSDARNVGMSVATGDYIAFVDSDDWIAPEMLWKLLEAIQRDGSDIAACAVEMVWEDENKRSLLTVQCNCVLTNTEAQNALLDESLLKNPVWYKLYKRETVQNVYFEVGKCHEDAFWSYRVLGNANKISLIDYIGYYYLQRPGSIMEECYSIKRLDAIEAFEQRYQYLSRFYPEMEVKARINVFQNCIYHGQMVLKYLEGREQKESLAYLDEVKKRYSIRRREYCNLKLTHRLWLDLARCSLKMTCLIKNKLKVGF